MEAFYPRKYMSTINIACFLVCAIAPSHEPNSARGTNERVRGAYARVSPPSKLGFRKEVLPKAPSTAPLVAIPQSDGARAGITRWDDGNEGGGDKKPIEVYIRATVVIPGCVVA
ncbi:hypothetical protein RhiXN_04396 [Rhizoctonia solani]|uniref:Uncharacterized protein n=1 Tax=Rhizoctonia solani TaxID=456999 RepID=A0A8H8NPU4_9AGAM|nr:uncharacterized protein RhiXN_04396 [Rhizoctonia solani]QRW16395.1 hypothetical protein RhiXN_04396 [Rhizoctonia solani]